MAMEKAKLLLLILLDVLTSSDIQS